MLRVERVSVNDIEYSIEASGYPMSTKQDYSEFPDIDENDYKRSYNLGGAKRGSGHDCFLKGILVSFDVIYPEYWSPQFQRYHFADIVSSQSKMHRITKFNIKDNCNKYVEDIVIELINSFVEKFNKSENEEDKYYWFMKIVSNLPMGFEKRMRITTNYLELKNIYLQRKGHKLKEDWGNFINWILTLPLFKELTGVK